MSPQLELLTVVSPMKETTIMRPQQLLQVVLVGYKDVKWQNSYSHDPNRIQLKALRQEVIQCDGFNRNRKGNFKIAFHSKKLHTWQHHYWFRVSPADLGKMGKLKGDVIYDLASLSFFHSHSPNKSVREIMGDLLVGELKVKLKITEEDREKYLSYLSQTMFKKQDPLAKEASYIGIGGRTLNEKDGYLFNPSGRELITLTTNQRSMIIEVPQPSDQQKSRRQWKIIPDKDAERNLSVSILPSRSVCTTVIQRFLVQNFVYHLPIGLERKSAGRLLLTVYDENNHRHVKFDRNLDFIVKYLHEPYYGDSGDECVYVVNRDAEIPDYEYTHDGDAEDHLETEFEFGNTVVRKSWAQRSKVEISEIDCEGVLEFGATSLKVREPRSSNLLNSSLKRVTYDDVVDGQMINLPEGYELVIVMDRDRLTDTTWGVSVGGKFLRLDMKLSDGSKERFCFHRKSRGEQTSDTDWIRFRWGTKTKEIRVIRVNKNYND